VQSDARLGLRRVGKALEQLLDLPLLTVEMLLIALQALDELLAVGEPAAAAAMSM
jgi:hypothetical protein